MVFVNVSLIINEGENMIKKLVAVSALFLSFSVSAIAKDLPDFTELAEKQGPSVVNISVTQVVQGQGIGGFPGMPNDEAFRQA